MSEYQSSYSSSEKRSFVTVLTRKQFLHHPDISVFRKNIIAASIIAYVGSGVHFLINIVYLGGFLAFMALLVEVSLALGIHLGQSRICSIGMIVYGVILMVLLWASSGAPFGVLAVGAGIYGLIITIKFHNRWRRYLTTNELAPIMVCWNCGSVIKASSICPKCGAAQSGYPGTSVSYDISYSNGGIYDTQTGEICLPSGTLINNRYQILDLIGEGGFCYTYHAYDTLFNTEVAVKEFFPHGVAMRGNSVTVTVHTQNDSIAFDKGKRRFLSEAKGLAAFNTIPDIVSIYDFFESNNTAYITMEYLNGQNLRDYQKSLNYNIPMDYIIFLADKMCQILYEVHSRGIIHRDISPDNIILCNDGALKLIDFGALKQDTLDAQETQTIIVKHGYAPIEQYYGNGRLGV